MTRSAKTSSSAAKASSRPAVRAAATSCSARCGAGDLPPVLRSTSALAALTAPAHSDSSAETSGRSTFVSPVRTRPAQSSDCSRKSAGSNIASAMPSSKAWGPLSMRFMFIGFSMMTLRAFAGPTRLGRR